MNQAKLDRRFFRRLWRIFRILFERYNSRQSLIFYVLAIVSLLLQFVIYAAGLVPSRFFEVLGNKDTSTFTQLAVYSVFIIILNAVMKSSLTYISRVLYLTWRERLCAKLHEKYFVKMNYYKLNVLDGSLDNMDQRITRDVNMFTREWSTLMGKLVVIPFTIVYYSYQCFVSTTWLGPVIIYGYFIVGTIVNRFIMAPIVRLNVEQEVREGDFRYQHLKVRVNSESMAFYRAGETEHEKSSSRLKILLKTQMSLYNWSFWLNSSVNIFDYVGGILSYLIIAIPIFAGVYNDLPPAEISALISKNSFVCIYLIHSFSQLIDMSSTVGDIAAHTHRVAQVFEAVDDEKDDTSSDLCEQVYENRSFSDQQHFLHPDSEHGLATEDERNGERRENEEEPQFFHLTDVTYSTPDSSVKLVKSLTMSMQAGKNILVTGATGTGKTSLLRILAGLWSADSGSLKEYVDFGPHGVMYLTQKPLLTDGTLQDQITYPRSGPFPEYDRDADKKRMEEIIEEVGLTDVIENNGGLEGREELNWSDKLSTGEMQRLSFARLFYHHPDFAVLDEPSSGLSKDTEDKMFESCHRRNITCLTVAHGLNLKRHHNLELHLHGDGDWTLSPLVNNNEGSVLSDTL